MESTRRVVPPHIRRRRRVTLAVLVAVAVWFVADDVAGNQLLRRWAGFLDERLADAPPIPDGPGQYAFLQVQNDDMAPVSYDPCRPIRVAVNPDDAPDDWRELVDTAMEHTAAATGFVFEYAGTTDSTEYEVRMGIPRYDQPVLVAWADEDEYEALEGDTAGVGGSVMFEIRPQLNQYLTGVVVLDEDVFGALEETGQEDAAQAIVDHEFGHLVGLDHVEDPRQLMYAENIGVTEYGAGDLKGLALLGRAPCR